jgi:acetyl esterase/lipase
MKVWAVSLRRTLIAILVVALVTMGFAVAWTYRNTPRAGPDEVADHDDRAGPDEVADHDDLVKTREGFKSEFKGGPAPGNRDEDKLPDGVKRDHYFSATMTEKGERGVETKLFVKDKQLKAWISKNVDTKPRGREKWPVVVYLHGDVSLSANDWHGPPPHRNGAAGAFVGQGFVVYMPMLRGENGNRGDYQNFLGEVDDVIAAWDHLSTIPNVDGNNVFLIGHSMGGILACLVSMRPSGYKAVATLDAFVDMEKWAPAMAAKDATRDAKYIRYDWNNPEEVRVRNPMAFASTLYCPLRLYVAHKGDLLESNQRLACKAQKAGKDCYVMPPVGGDHTTMVIKGVQDASNWFRELISR